MIEVINPITGSIVINDTFKNLALLEKGTLTTTSGYASGSKATLQKQDTTVQPNANYLLAAYAVGYGVCQVSILRASMGSGIYLYLNELYCSGPVGTTVYYYLFMEPEYLPTPTTVGYEVYNASGVRIFHSDYKYMRVATVETPANIGSFTYNGAKTYAFVTAATSSRIVAKGSPANLRDVYTKAIRLSGTSAIASEHWLVNGVIADLRTVGTYDNFSFMAIDVTGY